MFSYNHKVFHVLIAGGDITASTALSSSVPVEQITLSGDTLSSMVRVHQSSSSPQLHVEGMVSNGEGGPLDDDVGDGSDLSSNDGVIGMDSEDDSS